MHENTLERQPDDTDVQPDAPVLDIPDVTPDAPLHLPELLRLTPEASHLRPTSHARLHEVAHHILINQLRVLLRMRQHVRSGPHDTHPALQHIKELRQLVDIRLTHKIAEGILPRIILRRLHPVRILVHVHRAELIALKLLAIQSRPYLLEQDRPRTLMMI